MITINIDKAKAIGHDMRRAARAQEFAPLDDAIAKQIPGQSPAELEQQRQAVRDKYAAIQVAIDQADTPEAIIAALEANQ